MSKSLRKSSSSQSRLRAKSIKKTIRSRMSPVEQLEDDFLNLLAEASPNIRTQAKSARGFSRQLVNFVDAWSTDPENIDVYENQLNDWIASNAFHVTAKQEKEIDDLAALLKLLMGNVVKLEQQLALYGTKMPTDLRKRLTDTHESISNVKESISAVQQKIKE